MRVRRQKNGGIEVAIGNGAIIAAGAVVANDVAAHALVAGNPAVVLRDEVLHAPSSNG